eukprot:GAHX01002372.1.p1 GENE.GAHX01002372.1~~GAHX01002372.1.p1  ORF type:complete len:62 (-),score=17.20 GAHX01002372.1:173-358(-)
MQQYINLIEETKLAQEKLNEEIKNKINRHPRRKIQSKEPGITYFKEEINPEKYDFYMKGTW